MSIALELLKNVPLFQLFDDHELAELVAHVEERRYVAGQAVCKAGEPGGEMHVILDGTAETVVIDHDGRRVVIAETERGDIFGELSLLDGEPRSASVVATRPLHTCAINRTDLEYLFSKHPNAALDVLKVLGRRIRKTDEILRSRTLRNPNTVIEEQSSFGDRVSDMVASFGGSWSFINISIVTIFTWIAVNLWMLTQPFDPAPFIGLNLVLSLVAAMQAPIIMMSQNRQDTKDRLRGELDYDVNRRAEAEIQGLARKMNLLGEKMGDVEELLREKLAQG
jgi:uncharacterized membrane protein